MIKEAKNVLNFEFGFCRLLTRDNSQSKDHPSDRPTISFCRTSWELLMRQREVVMIQIPFKTIVQFYIISMYKCGDKSMKYRPFLIANSTKLKFLQYS
jgi:hypothetical protein